MTIENAINEINNLINRSKSAQARAYMTELVRCLRQRDASWQWSFPLRLNRSSAVRNARVLAWAAYEADLSDWLV